MCVYVRKSVNVDRFLSSNFATLARPIVDVARKRQTNRRHQNVRGQRVDNRLCSSLRKFLSARTAQCNSSHLERRTDCAHSSKKLKKRQLSRQQQYFRPNKRYRTSSPPPPTPRWPLCARARARLHRMINAPITATARSTTLP